MGCRAESQSRRQGAASTTPSGQLFQRAKRSGLSWISVGEDRSSLFTPISSKFTSVMGWNGSKGVHRQCEDFQAGGLNTRTWSETERHHFPRRTAPTHSNRSRTLPLNTVPEDPTSITKARRRDAPPASRRKPSPVRRPHGFYGVSLQCLDAASQKYIPATAAGAGSAAKARKSDAMHCVD